MLDQNQTALHGDGENGLRRVSIYHLAPILLPQCIVFIGTKCADKVTKCGSCKAFCFYSLTITYIRSLSSHVPTGSYLR